MSRKISLRHIRSFVELANAESFTVASARLFVTQSALTSTIQQFEGAVGLKLFDRTTRRVLLTQEGMHFKREAERILCDFDNVIEDLKAYGLGKEGHVRIAAAASVIRHFVVPAVAALRKQYPKITVSLRDTSAAQLEKKVVDGEVDFALGSKHSDLDEQLDYVPLVHDRYGIVCRPEIRLGRHKTALRWKDLPSEGYVSFTPDTGIEAFLREKVGQLPFFQGPHDEVSSTQSLYAILQASDRYSVVPALASSEAGAEPLRFRELVEPSLSREIFLITRRLRTLSPGSKRLLDALLATIDAQPLPNGVSKVRRT